MIATEWKGAFHNHAFTPSTTSFVDGREGGVKGKFGVCLNTTGALAR